MKIYIKFLIYNFLKSLIFVVSIIFTLVLILNLLTEIDFFRDLDVEYYFPLYISLLNSPSLIFEIFPFVFLIASQLFFINLFKNKQIETFKYSGLKNSSILKILFITSFIIGFGVVLIFYNISSNLKNIYLELKNNYTSDDKYLAVITNNGLWIKDNAHQKINIINASKIDETFLLDASITELNEKFDVKRHIEADKINIVEKKWLLIKPTIYIGNEKITKDFLYFYSNFDYERIQNLFSNLSSLSVVELFELRRNYSVLNLSTTEINLQIHKLFSYPVYLSLMTFLAVLIMFYTKNYNSNSLRISLGLFLSVLIYYINNFFNVMGKTEQIPVIVSIWLPMIILLIINMFYTIKINEK